jgi:ornithine cyclodeaminase
MYNTTVRLGHIAASELSAVLPWGAAVDALESAFQTEDPSAGPVRSHLAVPGGEMLLMPAQTSTDVGVKLVTLAPGNAGIGLPFIQGLYILLSPGTLTPELLIDGAALTRLRTAAVSALATRWLAPPDARHLVLFGAGQQAEPHAIAMAAVRPIERVTVVSRGARRARDLVDRLAAVGFDARTGTPDAVEEADIVCTCTTSPAPVFPTSRLREGAHVNAVGAYRPDRRELDGALLARSLLVVETRASALAEAGDILLAIAEGHISPSDIAGELADVVHGRVRRGHPRETTVFKSVGLGIEDLVLARAAQAGRERLLAHGA